MQHETKDKYDTKQQPFHDGRVHVSIRKEINTAVNTFSKNKF